ncbi:hypothetical protein DMC64_42455, partial [Amycolatopsis sp. WAC 04197]
MHIPPEVRKFLEVTLGLSWPESDDQGLVALWKTWEAVKEAVAVYEAAARRAGSAIPQALQGDTGEFFTQFLSATIPDGLTGLGEAAGELAKMSQNAAADVYKTKVMFVVFAAFTLASIIHLMATLIGALFTGAVIAAARVALTAIWKALVLRLSELSIRGGLSHATRTALLKAAKDIAIKVGGFAAFGAALMGGTDFGVQARQIADGDRNGWDTKSLTSSLVGGALGGAFAGIFHSAAGAIRKTAFDLRDRLDIDPAHLEKLVPGAPGTVTAKDVITAINKPLAAFGDAGYATGQVITTIATAPLINLALGAPAGNPALGALGALSKYGGGHTSTTTGTTLDALHPPVLPDLTIPDLEKSDTKPTESAHDKEKPSSPEKLTGIDKLTHTTIEMEAEPPPPYTAAPGQANFREEKTPAYTTSPQGLGALYTGPGTAAPGNGVAPPANGFFPATTSTQNGVRGTVPVVADVGTPEAIRTAPVAETQTSAISPPATATTGYTPSFVEAPLTRSVGENGISPSTSAERGSSGTSPSQQTPTAAGGVVADTRPGEVRPDSAGQARTAVQDASSSRVQADRAPVTTSSAPSPPVAVARPDTTGGNLGTPPARSTEAALADGTRSFLTDSTPDATRGLDTRTTVQATLPSDPAPPRSAVGTAVGVRPDDASVVSAVEPVRAIPLPGNGGIAFVPEGYATNVTNAFPEPQPGVFRVIAQHRDNVFSLLDPARQLAVALRDLPAHLASWGTYTRLQLVACDLTPAQLTRLAPVIRTTLGAELEAPYRETPIYITPAGDISTTDPGVPGTLHLAPKHRRDGSTVTTDPESPQLATQITEATKRILQQHGGLEVKHLLTYLDPGPLRAKELQAQIRQQFNKERDSLQAAGELWSPHYRGSPNTEKFDIETMNDFTSWIYRKVVAEQRAIPADIARSAQVAGFAINYKRLIADIEKAVKVAESDGRRHLDWTFPKDRDRITSLTEQLIANSSYRTPGDVVDALRNLNIRGESQDLEGMAARRERALKDDPRILAAATERGLPTWRPPEKFLGRKLNADISTDRRFIGNLAYAAASESKTATPAELTTQLKREGIAGEHATLLKLVTTAVDEATRNGDRLPTLTTAEHDHHNAILARTGAILDATPKIGAATPADQVRLLVKDMRIRHIAGPQEDLVTLAGTVLQNPGAAASAGTFLDPVATDGLLLETRLRRTENELAAVAERTLDQFGDLAFRFLLVPGTRTHLSATASKAEFSQHLAAARAKLASAGELWAPLYQGERKNGTSDKENIDALAVWLYRRVIAQPDDSVLAIARSAVMTGFALGQTQLESAVKAAMKAAGEDGRRHPRFLMSKSSDRNEIVSLIDRLLANGGYRPPDSIADIVKSMNVHGEKADVVQLVMQRERALKDDPQLLTTARERGEPARRPTGRFLGRALDTRNPGDRDLISEFAYVAAWENKTAAPADLTELLRREGIAGSRDTLLALVTDAADEAGRNGDRLLPLTTTDPDLLPAIQARVNAILYATPAIHRLEASDQEKALVKHLRMRHITGPRHDLEALARTALQTPATELPSDFSLNPIDVGKVVLNPSDPDHAPAIEALAREVIDKYGDIDKKVSLFYLEQNGFAHKSGLGSVLTKAKDNARADGSLWRPRYRGRQQQQSYSQVEPNDLSALLWQLAITNPRATAGEIARLAGQAGFTGYELLRSGAESGIEAAVLSQRRYPFVDIADPAATPMIDAIIANSPVLDKVFLVTRLREYNIQGSTDKFFKVLSARLAADRSEADVAASRAALTLKPDGWILGRFLDVADAYDRAWIDKLAYAAAWADKTATVDQLVARLVKDGVVDTDGGLTPLVTQVVNEATTNGDRYEKISADKPADHTAVLRRTGTLALKNHTELFALTQPDATTHLVRHMRTNHITGTQESLRGIADTVLNVRTDQPLPGTHTIPIPTYGGLLVNAIPLPANAGAAFVKPDYTTNITNAFPNPQPGVITILTHHDTTDTYHLDEHIPHTPQDLINTIANLPIHWPTNHTLTLLACYLTPTQTHHLQHLIHQHPTLHHLTLNTPHHNTPIHITTQGHITTTDPGQPNTLHLAPKHRRDGTTITTDPEADAKISATAESVLRHHGDLNIRHLLTSELRKAAPEKTTDTKFREHLNTTRKRLKTTGELWSPVYRGRRDNGKFDEVNVNDFTAWLYRQVITEHAQQPVALARSAAKAGFTSHYDQVLTDIKKAKKAAEADGRIFPTLAITNLEHADRIEALADQVLADGSSPNSAYLALRDLNVQGTADQLRALLDRRKAVLKTDPAAFESARARGRPALAPNGKFLGRLLDSDDPDDHLVIGRMAYALAWEKKTADVRELTAQLGREGVADSRGVLLRLVAEAVDEAVHNGDRLFPLSATDPLHQAHVRNRVSGILTATPSLRAAAPADQVSILVHHMRTRHITGPEEQLTTLAGAALRIPETDLAADFSLYPLDLDERKPRPGNPAGMPPLEEVARRIVDEHGNLESGTLRLYLNQAGVESVAGTIPLITAAKAAAAADGSAWYPTYRSRERVRDKYDLRNPNDLTAVMALLVMEYGRETPTEIARRAEKAGFAGYEALRSAAEMAIEAAVERQQRYPSLSIAVPEDRPRINVLLDGLIAESALEPSHELAVHSLVTRLQESNVRGIGSALSAAVSARLRDFQSARQAGLPDSALMAARALSTLQPDVRALGRSLDVAKEDDLGWIDKLAYAAAWADKNASVDQLVVRLTQLGVIDTGDRLTSLVTRIVAEAVDNGDRYETVSAGTPTALQRTAVIALEHGAFAGLEASSALTQLVRRMRANHITGTQQELREVAETALGLVRNDQPLPDAHTIPVSDFSVLMPADPSPDSRDTAVIDDTGRQPDHHGEADTEPLRTGAESAADPQIQAELGDVIRAILLQHGDLGTKHLLVHVPHARYPYSEFGPLIREQFSKIRDELKENGQLWKPLYRGKRNDGRFDKDVPDDLTAWLYRQVIGGDEHALRAIARSAMEAGFVTSYDQLLKGAAEAIKVAEADGRRYPELHLSTPGHRTGIVDLVDRLVASGKYPSLVQTAEALRKYNVHGLNAEIKNLIAERQVALDSSPALLAAAKERGEPMLKPSNLFLGRPLSADDQDSHILIGKLAYAAAWEKKTADIDELTDLLLREGVAGPRPILRRLVAKAVNEATLNGDRLVPLSSTRLDYHSDIEARINVILDATSALREPGRPEPLKTLVQHMRTRHIIGPQDHLEDLARTVLENPRSAVHPTTGLRPIDLPPHGLDAGVPVDLSTVEEFTKEVIAEHGGLTNNSLLFHLRGKVAEKDKTTLLFMINKGKGEANAEGSLWIPQYRGLNHSRDKQKYDTDVPNDLTALLWHLAIDRPRASATEIARAAEQAGFANAVAGALRAIEAATRLNRRHPVLNVSDSAGLPHINAMIDALIADNPGMPTSTVIQHLREHNVQGDNGLFTEVVNARPRPFTSGQDHTGVANVPDVSAGRALLGLVTEGNLLGRSLDVADAGDRAWIDKLAYAAAWADKTAT